LVVQNDPDKSLGRIGDELVRAGTRLDVRSPETDLPDVRDYVGLIVLPGLADPVDETAALRRARGAIDDALSRQLPILGLCLGGQLLVQALGGTVFESGLELGFHEVFAAPAAASDPLFSAAPKQFLVFHAHAYSFEPPSEAEVLLRNDVCVQACRQGEAWAVQCHPETPAQWVTALAAGIRGQNGGLPTATTDFFRLNGLTAEQVERDGELAEPGMRTVAAGIARGFAARLA
jgi:GMP synthase-like glutamine amidotransferase